MTLASSDPFAKPLIDPQALVHDFDISAIVQSIKDAQTFLQYVSPLLGRLVCECFPRNPLFANLSITPFGDLVNATTDADFTAYARKFAVSLNQCEFPFFLCERLLNHL